MNTNDGKASAAARASGVSRKQGRGMNEISTVEKMRFLRVLTHEPPMC